MEDKVDEITMIKDMNIHKKIQKVKKLIPIKKSPNCKNSSAIIYF